jgi:uncharacterized protein YdeI (YjbR/CyaY-like superfamily)
MITQSADYFTRGCGRCTRFDTPSCSVQTWSAGLAALRRICLGAGLTETVKWGHPCYMHGGRNIAIFGAFQDSFRISFMNGSLLKDTAKVLQKMGPNTANATVIPFTSANEVIAQEPIIHAYLTELMGYADAGLKPAPKAQAPLVLANELTQAMETDPAFAAAFGALTPGRKRSWNLHFASAKQSKTRTVRVAKARDEILAGKGRNERG